MRRISCRRAAVSVLILCLVGAGPPPVLAESEPAPAEAVLLEPLMADSLVTEALRRNPDLEAARHRYEAAREMISQAGTLMDPEFQFAWSPTPAETRSGPITYRFGLMQRFPMYGVLDMQEKEAAHVASGEEASVRMREFDLAQEVRVVFFEWIFALRAIEINTATRQLLAQFRRIAEQRYRVGLVPQADPLKAAVALSLVDAREAEFVRAASVARAMMNVLLNREPNAQLGDPKTSDPLVFHPSPAGLAEKAIENRPEIRATREKIGEIEMQLGLARRDYWPSWTLGVEYAPVKDGTNPGFDADGEDMFTASVGVNIPLQIGRRQAAVAEASEKLAAARSDLEAAQLKVRYEVFERHARFEEAARVLELYRTQIVPAVQLELDATRKAYESARVDFLNLLDSERSYEEILLQEAMAVRNYEQERARLERAIAAPLEGLPREKSTPQTRESDQ